jgi:hypothetical protein
MQPNKENLRKWIAALRSGEFKQGTGRLYSADVVTLEKRYCCLGVACEVAERDGVIQPESGDMDHLETPWRSDAILSPTFQAWLGVNSGNPAFVGHSAATWNDHFGKTFPVIATLIELEYRLNEGDDEGGSAAA